MFIPKGFHCFSINQVVKVDWFLHKNAFHFETVINSAFNMFHSQLGALNIFKFNENATDFRAKSLFTRPDDLDVPKLAYILQLCFKIVF